MKYWLLITIYSVALSLNAQHDMLKNKHLSILDTVECNGELVTTAKFWEVYQTQNGQWDGAKDTSACYEVAVERSNGFIVSNNFDLTKKVFFRYLPDTLESLEPNKIYGASAGAYLHGVGHYEEDCENRDCSGILIHLEIPDSTGTTTKIDELFFSYIDNFGEFCFATDRFEPAKLKEFIFQFQWDGPWSDTISLWAELQKPTYQGIVDNTIIAESNSTGEFYAVEHSSLNSEYSFAILLLNRDTLHYPSADHLYYEDLQLELNTPVAQEIRINVFGTLLFQSFAQLRGGLVAGSDSIRHKISYYIGDWGSFCLYHPAELVLENGGNLILNNGKINFYDKDACLQFSKGSKLIIKEGSQTVLGNQGSGILALRSGGEILVEKDASLVLDLKIEMHETGGETKPQNIYTYLSPGAHLSFTKNAMLSNQYSIDRQMKMFVFLNGGGIDMSALSPEEKALIVIIDQKENLPKKHWLIFPNPTADKLSYFNPQSEKTDKVLIYNMAGRKIIEGNHPSEIDVSYLRPGIYYLVISLAKKSETFKFVKG